jgi:nucleoside-diphosphate-sugar epimerase
MPKSSSKRGLVLVTGGSGYVAGYCIAELLNNGWRVRSTVRSSAKVKAVRAGISNVGSNVSEIEFVEADLNSDAGWSQATCGAQYVLHVASPVPVTDPKNDAPPPMIGRRLSPNAPLGRGWHPKARA